MRGIPYWSEEDYGVNYLDIDYFFELAFQHLIVG